MYYNMKDVEQLRSMPLIIPTTEDAVDMYRQQSGVLTDPSEFGTDPLENDIQKIDQREQEFRSNAMSVEDIFTNVISGNDVPFRQAILLYIDITDYWGEPERAPH